jgi:uncharacterized damage-inducible protein DinB
MWATGRGILDQQLATCTQDAWLHRAPNSSIDSISSIFAHIAYSEDVNINRLILGGQTIWHSDNWDSTTGLELPEMSAQTPLWSSLEFDMNHLKEYASEVKGGTERFFASLTDDMLDKKVQTGFAGEQTVAWALNLLVCWHVAEHSGEIAALLGAQGLKGLPF